MNDPDPRLRWAGGVGTGRAHRGPKGWLKNAPDRELAADATWLEQQLAQYAPGDSVCDGWRVRLAAIREEQSRRRREIAEWDAVHGPSAVALARAEVSRVHPDHGGDAGAAAVAISRLKKAKAAAG